MLSRTFTVNVEGDGDVARLVLGCSADGLYLLTANPVSNQMERVPLAKCAIQTAMFNHEEVEWAYRFGFMRQSDSRE